MTDTPAIEIRSLRKSFGRTEVLTDVSLTVPRGQTFAFLGRNGAGKTTTIRMLLGLLKPTSGGVGVLGLDPAKSAIEIRRRVGYLAEDQQMWGWMTVGQIIAFMAPFYPTWDKDLAKQYVEQFDLPAKTKIKHLSKGQNVRLGLLLALAHRPELVILDDPTLALDPIMRKQFLRDVVDHLQGSGVPVFFSSHLLYEIEPVADQVAILESGVIVRQGPTEQLRDKVKRLIFTTEAYDALAGQPGESGGAQIPGKLDVQRAGRLVAVVVEDIDRALRALAGQTPEVVDLNLDEIFEAYVIGKPDGQPNATGKQEQAA